jgi:peroxiredoxin
MPERRPRRTIRRSFRFGLIVLCAAAFAACAPENPDPKTMAIGTWQAQLALPGGAARFGMEVAREADTLRVTLINGSERISVPEASFEDGRLTLNFPAYNNRIDARLADGELSGSLTLVKRYGKTQIIPFTATPGAREPGQIIPAAQDVSGRWEVSFVDQEGKRYPAVGEFQQRGNRLFGTFLTQTGDYRYLGGSVNGTDMALSTFDGAHAFLFKATVQKDSSLQGGFWSGNAWQESWTAVRNDDARLADATKLTFLKPGYDRFTFEFPNLAGELVSLDDPRFDGKVVVVTLAGSWCPNCHDEAQFMAPFYARYRDQGLEVVALMYEHLEDREAAARQVQRFRDKFRIEYTTLLAGISDKTEAARTLPALNQVLAFPTTIFIDRRGKVRQIHTGFSGPGTGEHFEKLKRDYTALVESLLAEPVEPAPEAEAPEAGETGTEGPDAAEGPQNETDAGVAGGEAGQVAPAAGDDVDDEDDEE